MWWEDFAQPTCKNSKTCKYVGTDKCLPNCYWYYISSALYNVSEIPETWRKEIKLVPEEVDLQMFTICKQFENAVLGHVEKGNGLFIYSNSVGNGKTSWAMKILQRYIQELSMTGIRFDGPKAYYVNVSELFETLRTNMENKEVTIKIEKAIQDADLVIFDDMGVEAPTTWVKNKLYNYINYRYMNGKSMIVTSNLSFDQLGAKLDKRIADRIAEKCRPIHLRGISRRHSGRWWEDDGTSDNK